jgi:hypothetical protein
MFQSFETENVRETFGTVEIFFGNVLKLLGTLVFLWERI